MNSSLVKTKLKDVCKIEKGKIGITKAIEGKYPLVVTAEERSSHNEWHFDEPATIVPLVSSTGHGHASIKRLHYAEGKYAVGNILATLIPKDHKYLNAKYLYVYLTINKEELLVSQMTGAANVSLTLTRLAEVEIEVPDYEAQLKAIKKYEEAQRYKNSMNSQIETRSKLLERFRQQILQDAITGMLSEKWRKENPNIESAEVLLEKIKTEKEKLVKEGKIRKQKPLPPIAEDEIPFELPEGWAWCRLGEVVYLTRGSSPRPITHFITDASDGVNWIKIGDTQKVDKYLYDTEQKITPEGAKKSQRVEIGDLILSNSMSFGKAFILKTTGYIHDGWFLIKLLGLTSTDYFYYLLLSKLIQEQFQVTATGGVVQNIRSEIVYKTIIPLPPRAEQEYIASKIEHYLDKLDLVKELNIKNHETVQLLDRVLLTSMFSE